MWVLQMLTPLAAVTTLVVIYYAAAYSVRRKYAQHGSHRQCHMTPSQLDGVVRKLRRAYQLSHVYMRVSAWGFFLTFLVYPGLSAACFTMLDCREFDDGVSALAADLSHPCTIPGGSIHPKHLQYRLR